MPEIVDGIDGQTAVLDIYSYENGKYLSCFFIILYHLLDCKIILNNFFFFFFFYENFSLPLSPSV